MTLSLGRDSRDEVVALNDEERSRHVHIVGASGSGKSKFMESLLRQDITAGRGLCLIDPHGTLADDVVQWCAATGMNDFRKIHVIVPSDLSWTVGFNPLRDDGRSETSSRVDAMVSACAQVWGGESTNATPLLKKCLRAVFYTLAVRNLTLAEATMLTTSGNVQLRRSLTDNLPDPILDAVWQEFEGLQRREFSEQFSSTNNRLMEFLSSPVVRRIIGQQAHALDLRKVMDEDEILIVNLKPGGALSADNARVLGTLLTSELFLLARTRDQHTASSHPFSLYIDECYDYLTSDIEKMLDQTRKFGLHLVLGHQRLGQLGDRFGSIFNGVMAGGQTKVVFGGLSDEDADYMAREIMRTTMNLERPKHILDKPVVVDEVPFWLESESWGSNESTTLTEGETSSWSSSEGESEGSSQGYNELDEERGYSESRSSSWSTSSGGARTRSVGETRGTSHARGRSQTLKPVRKMMVTAVHSLEEEMHLAIIKLRELARGTAIVKRPGKPPTYIRTQIIRPALASELGISAFVKATRDASPYISEAAIADTEIALRQRALLVDRTQPDDGFWSPEGD